METGSHIKFKINQETGIISKVLGKNKLEIILDNGFTVQAKIDQIELCEAPKKEDSTQKKYRINLPPMKVDLHIECLINDHEHMTNADRIQLQIQTFEYNLDSAIAAGMLEITFVHGIGQGILRNEIHARLKKNKHIKSFGDAQFDRGATLVKIY